MNIKGIPINKFIEHTNVKPTATPDDIRQLCIEAQLYDFYGVCVNSYYAPYIVSALKNMDIKAIQVVGFPFGASMNKHMEIFKDIDEVDMVLSIGLLKAKVFKPVGRDIKAVVNQAYGKLVKVIISTPFLTKQEIKDAVKLIEDNGAGMVKTCTGYEVLRGVSVEDINIISKNTSLPIKASGGIKDYKTVLELTEAGAVRIGTSSGIKIMEEAKSL